MEINNVLSLFDGVSGGQLALQRAGIPVENYYASEVDKYAMQITMKNFPDTIQIGDVRNVKASDLPKIDLLIGGSPCQGFSNSGKGLNFDDPRSALFFEYVRILKELREINPDIKFLLENVKMKKQWVAVISEILGVKHIEINSALVSAQNRKRLYWANFPISQPEDRGILLKDILEEIVDCPIGIRVREKSNCIRVGGMYSPFGARQSWCNPFQRVSKDGRIKSDISKSGCITAGANSAGNHSQMDIIHSAFGTRRYSVIECERLQTMPDNYTEGVSNSQRYKMIGNGWTIEVISHIFKNML